MIHTVTGPIPKEALGPALSHEHIAWDAGGDHGWYLRRQPGEGDLEPKLARLLPVFADLLAAGCRAVAEASPPEGGPDPRLLHALSTRSGITLLTNTGSFLGANVFPRHLADSIEAIAARWIQDFEEGLATVDGTIIRPGFLKVALNEGDMLPLQEKLLRAAARTSRATGLPIQCHIMEARTALQALAVLGQERCDPSRFLWAHACREADFGAMRTLGAEGVWLGFDLIRRDTYHACSKQILRLLEMGLGNRLLLSQDEDLYEQAGPGHPCAGLFTGFLPYCVVQGLPLSTLHRLLTENPRDFFDTPGPGEPAR